MKKRYDWLHIAILDMLRDDLHFEQLVVGGYSTESVFIRTQGEAHLGHMDSRQEVDVYIRRETKRLPGS